MTQNQPDETRDRRAKAMRLFAEHPSEFSDDMRRAILAGKVIPGMKPFDAHLAAGLFQYAVEADSSVWPRGADPMDVIWAQSTRPDASAITMTFETATQFPELGRQRFSVHFRGPRLLRIERIGGG